MALTLEPLKAKCCWKFSSEVDGGEKGVIVFLFFFFFGVSNYDIVNQIS